MRLRLPRGSTAIKIRGRRGERWDNTTIVMVVIHLGSSRLGFPGEGHTSLHTMTNSSSSSYSMA